MTGSAPLDRPRARRFAPGGALAAALAGLWAAATLSSPAQAEPHSSFIIPTMPGNGFRVDMGTMLDRRFYSVIRQRYDYSCGSAALATLMRYHYGITVDEEATFSGMWEQGDQEAIRKSGFSLLDMKRYLAAHGLETQGFRVTLDQIAQTGVPGIALTVTKGYHHFVVIKGVSEQGVLVGDPSRGLIRYSRDEFGKLWDGLYFVITSAREVGQASFNRPAQWAVVGNVPLTGPQSRPPESEAVRIGTTAPFLGEL